MDGGSGAVCLKYRIKTDRVTESAPFVTGYYTAVKVKV